MQDARRGQHILVIDDSLDYLNFMETLLKSEGFSVDSLQSAESLNAVIAGHRPDVIVTDVCIPGLAPFAVVDQLREDERSSEIPILVCTGAVNETVARQRSLSSLNADLLMKPFDIDTLLAKITALLPAAREQSPAPR